LHNATQHAHRESSGKIYQLSYHSTCRGAVFICAILISQPSLATIPDDEKNQALGIVQASTQASCELALSTRNLSKTAPLLPFTSFDLIVVGSTPFAKV
jgi:hypothetical protein